VIETQKDTGISPSLLLATGMQSDKRQARQGDIATSVKRYSFYARNMRQTLARTWTRQTVDRLESTSLPPGARAGGATA
jgi:hypothetical protein